MDLRRFDLNLLLVFDVMMAERNVTRAGERLALSQPAVSHALNKLRSLLGDDLFERSEGIMKPTPRALEIAGPVREALMQLQVTLDDTAFDPFDAQNTFNIAFHNYASTVLATPLARRLRDRAPQVRLHISSNDGHDLFKRLGDGAYDILIGPTGEVPPGFESVTLLMDSHCGLARHDHPLFDREITRESLSELPVIAIGSLKEQETGIFPVLIEAGIDINTMMTVPHLFAAINVLRDTDMVTYVLQRVQKSHTETYANLDGLRAFALPMEQEPVPCRMVWHKHMTNQSAHRWMRDQIAECFREVM